VLISFFVQETELVDALSKDLNKLVAAGKKEEELAASRKVQAEALARSRNRAAVQQELLHAMINKSLFSLLLEQQTQLATLRFPRFTLSFIETLKASVLQRSLAVVNKSTNTSSAAASAALGHGGYDEAILSHVSTQRALVCALLSVRLDTVSKERSRAAAIGKTRLSRASSIDSAHADGGRCHGGAGGPYRGTGNGHQQQWEGDQRGGGDEDAWGNDINYYDAEAKKLRKRRRLIAQHHNDSYSSSNVSSYTDVYVPPQHHHQRQQQQQPYPYQQASQYASQYPPDVQQRYAGDVGGGGRGIVSAGGRGAGRGVGGRSGGGRGGRGGGGGPDSGLAALAAPTRRSTSQYPHQIPPGLTPNPNAAALQALQKLTSLIQDTSRK
jgi:hypothetical protein